METRRGGPVKKRLTALDLYEIIVGEGGVSPEYFLTRMQWWEVQRYIYGVRRRARPTLEAARIVSWTVAKMFGDKSRMADMDMQDFMPFAWEQQAVDPDEVMRQTEVLLAESRAYNARQKAQG